MTNTMNKLNNKIMLMTVAFLLLFTAIPVKAQDMQDESAVSGNGLGIDVQTQGTDVVEGEDSVNPLGAMNSEKYYELKNAWDGKVEGVDYINFTVPDAGLWWYDQSFARGELFNAFQNARMNPNNWWYCTNGSGEAVTKATVPEPVKFEYDYELERCAMQRVLEVTFVDDHYRPDGISCDEVFLDLNSPYQYAAFTNELNSAVTILGQSAEQIVDMYMEAYSDKVMCAGEQEHRKAIIGAGNNSKAYRIGIGVIRTRAVKGRRDATVYTSIFIANDNWNWSILDAEGLSNTISGTMPHYTTPAEEVNEYRSVTVRLVTNGTGYNGILDEERNLPYGGIWMKPGETYDMNDKWFYDSGANIALVKGNYDKFNFYSKDTSVATVANGIITAVGEGSTQIFSDLTYPLNGALITITVTKPQNEGGENQISGAEDSDSTNVDATPVDDIGTAPAVTGPESVSGGQEPLTEGAATPVTTKQNQTIKVKKSSYTYKYKTLKKKAKKFRIKPTVNNGEAHGIVSYKVIKYPKGGKKYITVDKKGNVTLKKKAKKGTYKIRITAGETRDMNSATKTITIKVK